MSDWQVHCIRRTDMHGNTKQTGDQHVWKMIINMVVNWNVDLFEHVVNIQVGSTWKWALWVTRWQDRTIPSVSNMQIPVCPNIELRVMWNIEDYVKGACQVSFWGHADIHNCVSAIKLPVWVIWEVSPRASGVCPSVGHYYYSGD